MRETLPNQAAPGNDAVASRFQTAHLRRAVPERGRYTDS